MTKFSLPAQIKSCLVVVTFAMTSLLAPATVHAQSTPETSGPFATILFSRTEMTAADNCKANDTNIARLDTVVAPYLASRGMIATGTLVTSNINETGYKCTHYSSSLMASWAQATTLSQLYGWNFVSHTATYPSNLNTLTPDQAQAETCGSAQAIDAHGLPGGHGMIAYPGSQSLPTALQTNYASKCFAWGREYGSPGITTPTDAATSPYWQHTIAPNGGPCNLASAPCYKITARGSNRYSPPINGISYAQRLQPGMWFTVQSYILVTGKSPAYSKSTIKWDCTSPDWHLHWTNDNERYCYSDWQKIIDAIAAVPGIKVTDPLTVGIAFGRPATY